jgi:RNA polymerase sigma-70 factor (ECF subfamily)
MRDVDVAQDVDSGYDNPDRLVTKHAGRDAPVTERPGECEEGWRPIFAKAVQDYRELLKVLAHRGMAPDLRSKGDASDLVQETFIEVYREYYRFEGLSDEEFKALLIRIMLNNLKSFIRRYRGSSKRSVAREVPIDGLGDGSGDEMQVAGKGASPSECVTADEDLRRLTTRLHRLPERDQMAVKWRAQEGSTYREIGKRLGCSPVAARKLWLRVVERLRRELNVTSS